MLLHNFDVSVASLGLARLEVPAHHRAWW